MESKKFIETDSRMAVVRGYGGGGGGMGRCWSKGTHFQLYNKYMSSGYLMCGIVTIVKNKSVWHVVILQRNIKEKVIFSCLV